MKFKYLSLSSGAAAQGVVVVIDVLRAFTTAAYAFNQGVEKIIPVGTVQEALALKEQIPGSLLMGEEGGIKPAGFDLGNSPAEILKHDLSNKILIQRTSAGTQGLVQSGPETTLIAASFVVARATAEFLNNLNPDRVSFIITGKSMGRDGDEDLACAEYIAALIQNQTVNPDKFTSRILTSSVGRGFLSGENSYLSQEDIFLSSQVNQLNFIMIANKEDTQLTMSPYAY